MPRGDGTGPTGQGARTGRGMGTCKPNSNNSNNSNNSRPQRRAPRRQRRAPRRSV